MKLPFQWILGVLLCIMSSLTLAQDSCAVSDSELIKFLEKENELLRQRKHAQFLAAYEYNTNVTEFNRQAMISISTKNAKVQKDLALRLKQMCYKDAEDCSIKRQIKELSRLGFNVLEEHDFRTLQDAISAMQTNYATAMVCSYTDPEVCTLTLEPHIQERLVNSRDPKELEHYWVEWHKAAGKPMRENFQTYVKLSRKAAHLNNFHSYAEEWIDFYEDPDFEKNLDETFQGILPLYKEIHGYVRHRLRQHYGPEIVPETGNIPMHLLGNMWAQQWDQVIDLFTPFPNSAFIDVKSEMEKQNYNVTTLFEITDEFFKSLNMISLPESFWSRSVLQRPGDRAIICHASAWDLYQDNDVRVKMCTEVDMHYLYVVSHELGHIQYYLQYANQPTVFRQAPNPGFHEATGDVVSLSVMSPRHLNAIGLFATPTLDEKSRINELFKTALKKIVFLPFAYTMDKWRYGVFRNDINDSQWNSAFWEMRSKFSGVEPPVQRSDDDFDPPAKYHIDADVEYLRYFAAHIFQFQFHKALCIKAGQYEPGNPEKPLDNCDIFNSKAAGEAFSKFLSVGSTKHWKETLKELTGETTMNPSALTEYFEPLMQWLKAENRRLDVPLGWEISNQISKS